MAVKEVTPQQAHDTLQSDVEAVYIMFAPSGNLRPGILRMP